MFDKENYKMKSSDHQPFCKCSLNTPIDPKSPKKTISCQCGLSEVNDEMEWGWDEQSVSSNNNIAIFHPLYSQGTAIIRGRSPLQLSHHHFFEIKICSAACGTDLSIGIGTENVDLQKYKYRFVSALGLDDQSWGYSYRGVAQTKGQTKYYGSKFGQGDVLGCHLDLFRGKLEFYINRLPQGIAFRDIPVDGRQQYYPMVSATAAKSSVKLVNSSSFPECLQYLAIKTISKHPNLLAEMKSCPGLSSYRKKLWLQASDKFRYSNDNSVSKRPFVELLFDSSSEPSEKLAKFDDIYEDIAIQINDDSQPTAETDDEDIKPSDLIFSFFCDHDFS